MGYTLKDRCLQPVHLQLKHSSRARRRLLSRSDLTRLSVCELVIPELGEKKRLSTCIAFGQSAYLLLSLQILLLEVQAAELRALRSNRVCVT